MDKREIRENQENLISLFEEVLGVTFPQSCRQFLLNRGSAVVDGFKVVGIPTEKVELSVFEATETLRKERTDLPLNLVVVIPIGSFVCCLDLSQKPSEDASLVEVDLESNTPPMSMGQTFSEWLEHHEKWEKRFNRGWTRVGNRQAEAEGKNRIQDWSAPIFRVKDYIIGIAAFRFSYKLGCLEADEFLPVGQPHVKKGEPVKVLLSEAFARARDYTTLIYFLI